MINLLFFLKYQMNVSVLACLRTVIRKQVIAYKWSDQRSGQVTDFSLSPIFYHQLVEAVRLSAVKQHKETKIILKPQLLNSKYTDKINLSDYKDDSYLYCNDPLAVYRRCGCRHATGIYCGSNIIVSYSPKTDIDINVFASEKR